jgi:hypothetical protein
MASPAWYRGGEDWATDRFTEGNEVNEVANADDEQGRRRCPRRKNSVLTPPAAGIAQRLHRDFGPIRRRETGRDGRQTGCGTAIGLPCRFSWLSYRSDWRGPYPVEPLGRSEPPPHCSGRGWEPVRIVLLRPTRSAAGGHSPGSFASLFSNGTRRATGWSCLVMVISSPARNPRAGSRRPGERTSPSRTSANRRRCEARTLDLTTTQRTGYENDANHHHLCRRAAAGR